MESIKDKWLCKDDKGNNDYKILKVEKKQNIINDNDDA